MHWIKTKNVMRHLTQLCWCCVTDITGEENAIRKSVNRELMLTSHFVDDAYDLANSSHKRDEEILKHASQAIVSTTSCQSASRDITERFTHISKIVSYICSA